MSQPNTIVRARLIKDDVSDTGSNFKIDSQTSGYNLFNGVGVRIQCAWFEKDGSTLIDPGTILTATHVVRKGSNSYMLQVKAGPFPQINAAQWNDGSGYHVEFAFAETDTPATPGTDYFAVIFGNTSDSLAAVDYCCVRPLTILDSRIPTIFTGAVNDATALTALKQYLDAQLIGYAKKFMAPGETITFQTGDGKAKRILGVTRDAVLGVQPIDATEIVP